MGNDVWSVFNVVQEKIIHGGFDYISGTKVRKARKVKNFKQDQKINKELFELALRIRCLMKFRRDMSRNGVVGTEPTTRVWLNGTFDLLHYGHIHLFQHAKNLYPNSIVRGWSGYG